MSEHRLISAIDEGKVTITGEVFPAPGDGHRYIVGHSGVMSQPVLAIQVGGRHDDCVDIHLEYTEESLAAAKALVTEIEAGIKERNDA